MKNLRVFFIIIACVVFSLTSCSSVDKDAKKAAELNKESLELIRMQDLENAEKKYSEAQAIISSYKDTENFEKFYSAYTSYMLEKAANN